MHEVARGITVAQLLQHRSGLPAEPPGGLRLELYRYAGTDDEARIEVARTLLSAAPEAPPGQRFCYSNAGYMVAGAIAARVGGRPWAELMRRELFEPLGMASAGFGSPGRPGAVDAPWGHRPGTAGPVPVFADNPPSLGPAGTVHATLRDWAKFARLHLGAAGATSGLLRAATLAELHAPPPGCDYASGWIVTHRDWATGPILTHTGSNTMWFAVAWLAPAVGFGVLVTCNQGDAGAACDAVAAALVERFGPR